VLAQVRHQSKREVEELVARLRPQPPVPDVIRKLPSGSPAASAPTALLVASHETTGQLPSTVQAQPAARRAVIRPLAAECYKVQFTASTELRAKLREAQALLRHQILDGDLEQIFDRALKALHPGPR
jgi:hypothetical protein